MKSRLLLFLFPLFVFACKTPSEVTTDKPEEKIPEEITPKPVVTKSFVSIRGKSEVEGEHKLIYSPVHSDFYYPGFKKNITIGESGQFEFKFPCQEVGFINLYIPGVGGGQLLVSPRKTYEIGFVSDANKSGKLEVYGEAGKSYPTFSTMMNPGFIYEGLAKYDHEPSRAAMLNVMEQDLRLDIENLRVLRNTQVISLEEYELAKLDRELYYAALVPQITMSEFYEYEQETLTKEQIEVLENHFKENPLNPKMMKSKWFKEYAEAYVFLKQHTDAQGNPVPAKPYDAETYHTEMISGYKNYLPAFAHEPLTAATLNYAGLSANFESDLYPLSEGFIKDYPDSEYLPYLKDYHEGWAAYERSKTAGFPEGVTVIESSEVNSKEELFALLKGKKQFVDVWATWCGPCKQDFTNGGEGKKLLQKEGYEIFYISVDDDKRDGKWKELIKFYDLKGTHIRLSKKVADELQSELAGPTGTLMLPWYFMTDEKGNITNDFAPRPSFPEILEKALRGEKTGFTNPFKGS